MLIYFNATVEELGAADAAELEVLISRLLSASSHGRHLILIDRQICTWVIDHLDFNSRELAQLSRLKEVYAQRGDLSRVARSILEVQIGGTQLEEFEPHKYKIGHQRFLETNYLDAAGLLVEHIENDGDILKLILNQVRRKHPVGSFHFSLLHGGGADIAACLRVEIPNRRVVVSVVDSDKVAPSDSSSATKRNLDREAQKQTFVGMVCETPCKESENYIPFEILRTHSQRICPEYHCFDRIEKLIAEEDVGGASDSVWLFLDLKRGVEAEKLEAVAMEGVISWLRQKFQLDGEDDFSEVHIAGFGDAILRQFLECGEAVKDFVAFMQTSYWATHFGDFFDRIYWYFVAEKTGRSI